MSGKDRVGVKVLAVASLIITGVVAALMPTAARAEYAEMLYNPTKPCLAGPTQQTTLRTPLLQGAPFQHPGSAAPIGQPPPVGDGSVPRGVIRGDRGGPSLPPTSFADPTHGNIFGTRGAQGPKGPVTNSWGRYQTQNGQMNGVYENGAPINGRGNYEPGIGNGGRNTFESGQGNNGSWMYEGGAGNGGSGMYEGGWGNGGRGTFEGGQGNGGSGMYEGGAGNGGQGMFEGGQGNGGRGTFEGGQGNGGMGMFEGGAGNGGQGTFQGGAGNGGQGIFEPGAGNGGLGLFESGAGNGGNRQNDFGAGSNGQQVVNNGGNNNGLGIVNNGGAKGGAQGEQDTQLNRQKQSPKYEFQGPLPTVKTFSRYLVILGVVMATIIVSLAAWSMVFGSPYGGSRVIGAVGGLLLLLAGYTIWKIVQMNTFDFNSTGTWAQYQDGTQMNIPGPGGANPGGPFQPPQNPGPPPANSNPNPNPNPGGGPFVGPQNPGGAGS